VRAHANWQGRLAAAALSVQRGHDTRVLPEHVCWRCFSQQRGMERGMDKPIEIESSYGDDEEFRENRCDDDDDDDEDDEVQDDNEYNSEVKLNTKQCNEAGDSGIHITPNVIYIM